MTNFTYTRDIPDGPNNPSVDQPKMKINTNSTSDLIAVDHNTFGVNNGGYHTVIHQEPQLADPAAIPGIGQTYVKTDITSGNQNLFFESGNGVITRLTSIVSGTGSIALTSGVPAVLLAGLPNDCIGFVDLKTAVLIGTPTINTLNFMVIGGVGYACLPITTGVPNIIVTFSGTNLTIQTDFTYSPVYKYIYWTV